MKVLVTGTSTEVGKTWVAARILEALRAEGLRVAARKPVQSFQPGAGLTDAEVLGRASGESPSTVCPTHRWLEVPIAPPMAARTLGRELFTVKDLVSELHYPGDIDVVVVEGVGGPRSPLADGGDTVDLALAFEPDMTVLVADPGLGAINAVVLSVASLPPPPPAIVLNRYDEGVPLHLMNADWLRREEGLDVVTGVDALLSRLLPASRARHSEQ